MKKYFVIIIIVLVLALGVSGFMLVNNSNAEKSPAKQTEEVATKQKSITEQEEQKAPEQPKYNIDKIVVATEAGLLSRLPEFQPLNDFTFALLNEIAKENNITIETKELPSFDAIRTSLSNKETDVQILSFAEMETDLTMTYSYVNTAIYHDGGKVTQPERDYTFIIHQDNTELAKLLNDHIEKFKSNGKLEELKKQYLGQ